MTSEARRGMSRRGRTRSCKAWLSGLGLACSLGRAWLGRSERGGVRLGRFGSASQVRAEHGPAWLVSARQPRQGRDQGSSRHVVSRPGKARLGASGQGRFGAAEQVWVWLVPAEHGMAFLTTTS